MATGDAGPAAGGPRPRRPWDAGVLLVALVLLAGSLVLPWWSVGASGPGVGAAIEYGLTAVCVRPAGVCSAYGTIAGAQPGHRPVADAFAAAFGLTALAVLAALLAFLVRLRKARSPAAAAALAVVSGVAALAASITLYLSMPGALGAASGVPYGSVLSGFFGSMTDSGVTVAWGGAAGWAASLAGGVLLLVAGAPGLLRLRRERAAAVGDRSPSPEPPPTG